MKKIFSVVFLVGLLMLIGTAGASDLDVISGLRETLQSIMGLLMVLIGFIGGRLWITQ